MIRKRNLLVGLLAAAAAACGTDTPQALGTLEYDRITLPAPAAERIVEINVREGQRVVAGQSLLKLEAVRTESTTRAALAEAQRQREALSELEAGARSETIARARAQLADAQVLARDARTYYLRVQPMGARQLIAASEVDRARAAANSADAQVRAARASMQELEHGTRREQIAQGEAAARAAEAQASAQQVTLDKLNVVAPRGGRVDSLPYRLGDQAPIGAPLAVMLVGESPYARVYVPEPIRANVKVGQGARIYVGGRKDAVAGRVRMIRNDPSFTPYYALIGEDAARLSYLAEVQLDKAAGELPAGLPVRVEFEQ
ncbi:HlyD family secretion protein [Lysobacter niabensis]|uniref:HlyD family secretion protein n=1 Tax=Agrilutibacter niabensis TaxID=380628 RepID=UPI003611B055